MYTAYLLVFVVIYLKWSGAIHLYINILWPKGVFFLLFSSGGIHNNDSRIASAAGLEEVINATGLDSKT